MMEDFWKQIMGIMKYHQHPEILLSVEAIRKSDLNEPNVYYLWGHEKKPVAFLQPNRQL